ncbi:MAG: adenylate/guanylate cyclase domain-containing protein [Actinomycetia bacterium]|nr:adenylate/guanylate cyclase domain-containing protein [Actinomycetes bacterium]
MSDPVVVALNADIVSYSRLMADDAQHTATALRKVRTVVADEIAAGGGSLLNFVGDNFMAVFNRPEQAVRTAITITNVVAVENASIAEYLRLRFRMGIDMGPVHIDKDGSHLGDALNIAARIQSIAQPGGLSISGEVFRALDEPSFRFRSNGMQRLKNIPEQVHVYDFADLPAEGDTAPNPKRPLSLGTPSVAVLPMHIASDADSLKPIAAFLLSDVVSGLINLRNLDVVDVTTSGGHVGETEQAPPNVRYMLLSGILQAGSRIRLWAQIRDVLTQSVLWVGKWDCSDDGFFDISDALATDIVRAFEIELIVGEPARVYQELGNPEAIAKVYEGWYNLTAGTRNGWNRANELFRELRADAPTNAVGPVLYAFTQWMGARDGLVNDRAEAFEEARANAQHGLDLGDNTGLSAMILAAVELEGGDADAALEGIAKAKILRPTCDLTWAMEGSIRRYLGQWEQAVVLIDQAMDLSPVNKPWYPTVLASSYYVGQKFEEAAAVAEEVLEHQPKNIEALLVLAASQSHLGLDRRAQATGALIVDRFPDADTSQWLLSNPYQDDEFVDRWRHDLESAGLLSI